MAEGLRRVSERSCKYAQVTGLTRRHVLECLAGGREEEKDVIVSKGKDLPGAHQYYSFGKSSAFARKGDWAISMVMRATAVVDLFI